MKKLITVLSLTATTAFASQAPGKTPADLEAIASANRYIEKNCEYDLGDLALVLESSVDEARRYDQNFFDHYFTMTYGSRDAHTGRVTPGALVLSGVRDYSEVEISWTVSSDALLLCR